MPNFRDAVCNHCLRSFAQQVRRGSNPARYCSPRCKNSAGAKLRIQRNQSKAERRCYKCKQTRPTDAFASASHSYCRLCNNEVQREWRSANPSRVAEHKKRSIARAAAADPDYYRKLTLSRYGLTLADFERMLRDQGGMCGICRTDRPGGRHDMWHVDHDRSCCPRSGSCGGCVRGLLCDNCNKGLGMFADETERLRAAALYLQRTRQSQMNRQLKLVIA